MVPTYPNDPTIPHNERLFRRINLKHLVESDGGKAQVSSAAFRNTELSVTIENALVSAGRLPKDTLGNYPNDLLMSLTAGLCRDHGQQVGPDPTPEEPAHGYVFGKKSPAIRRALRDAANWVVPDEVPSSDQIRVLKKQLEGSGDDPEASD